MSFPFTINSASLQKSLGCWKAEDVWRFSWRAASGLPKELLAEASGVGVDVVEALLAEPAVEVVVSSYRQAAESEPEQFREHIRPLVRLAIEKEFEKEQPDIRIALFCMFCLEFAKTDPVEKAIDALVKSLNAKRRAARKAAVAAKPSPPPPDEIPPPALEPSEAERKAAFAKRTLNGLERNMVRAVSRDALDPAGQHLLKQGAPSAGRVSRNFTNSLKHSVSPVTGPILSAKPQNPPTKPVRRPKNPQAP